MIKIVAAIVGAALIFAPIATEAQEPAADAPVTLENTVVRALHSKINGVDYQLTVVLPPNYDKAAGKRYPTLYVMDGNRWAQLLAVVLPRFVANASYPPIIVVGVDYPGKTGRYQDYGPLSQRYFPVPQNRGAANFMRVMKEEIVPLIDRTYRTDPKERGIGGHSMGGFFAAYSLLHAADTFNRFWISSPSLFYDDEVLFKDFGGFHGQTIDRPLFVFTDVGGDELPMMRNVLTRFGQQAVAAHPDRVVLESLVVPNTDHATVVPAVLAPMLEHLFQHRRKVIPLPTDLIRFAGQYKLPSGTVLTFVTDGESLHFRDTTVDFETGSLLPLTAAQPNRFFRRGSATEFEFPAASGKAGLVWVINRDTGEVVKAVRQTPRDDLPVDKVEVGQP